MGATYTFRQLNATTYQGAARQLKNGETLAVSLHSADKAAGSGYWDVHDKASFNQWKKHSGIKVLAKKAN